MPCHDIGGSREETNIGQSATMLSRRGSTPRRGIGWERVKEDINSRFTVKIDGVGQRK